MANVSVNGISVVGGSIVIRNGQIIVDGKDVTPDAKVITINVQGDVEKLDVGACSTIDITGNAGAVRAQAGDITVGGNVGGDVSSQAGDIDVTGTVSGNVHTQAGDIRYRR
jgi:hypothetical protein